MIAPIDENSDNSPSDDSDKVAPVSDSGIFHISPDGLLALTVTKDVDGEELIGFHGFDWSVQVSILSELASVTENQARNTFIANVLEDDSIIAVLRKEGEIADVWITDEPKMDLQYLKANEEIEFRYWSGTRVEP